MNNYAFKYRSLLFTAIFIIGFGAFPGLSLTNYLFVLYRLPVIQLKEFVIACSLVGIAGFFIRVWGSGYLGASIVHAKEIHSEELITSGPYAYMRNPLYFGTILMMVGFLPVLTLYGFAFIIIAMGTLICLLIRGEEKAMLSTHGREYLEYRSRTHAMIPKLRKFDGYSAKFNLKRGLKSEILYIFAFSPLIGGIFFSSMIFYVAFYSLLIIGLILFMIFRDA